MIVVIQPQNCSPSLPCHESTASIKITDKFCVIFQFFYLSECFSVLVHVPQTNETPSGEGSEIKFTGQLSVIYLCIISIATPALSFVRTACSKSREAAVRARSKGNSLMGLFTDFFSRLQQVKDIILMKSRAFCFNRFQIKILPRYMLSCFLRIMRNEEVETPNFF